MHNDLRHVAETPRRLRGLRVLARRLVGDTDAEDLLQDAWLVALERAGVGQRRLSVQLSSAAVRRPSQLYPKLARCVGRVPGPSASQRESHGSVTREDGAHGWLARVVLHRARNWIRARALQRSLVTNIRGEEELGPAPDSKESLEERDAAAFLARTVAKLPEIERQVVELHYYQGLTSREVGALLAVPSSTVRWRLRRAVRELRKRFTTEDGRQRWVTALAPLATRRSANTASNELRALAPSTGAPALPWLAALGWIAAATVACIGLWFSGVGRATRGAMVRGAVVDGDTDGGEVRATDSGPSTAGTIGGPTRVAVAGPPMEPVVADVGTSEDMERDSDPALRTASGDLSTLRIAARVVTRAGDPIANAELALAGDPTSFATAGGDGWCDLVLSGPAEGPTSPLARAEAAGELLVSAPGHASLSIGLPSVLGADVVLGDTALARGRKVTGCVLTSEGRPVVGADVGFVPSSGFSRALEFGRDPANRSSAMQGFAQHVPLNEGPACQTDHAGRFELRGLPVAPGRVVVHHAALSSGRSEPLPAEGDLEATVVLRSGAAQDQLHVLVVTPDGEPAPSALVEVSAPGGATIVLRADEGGFALFPTADIGPFRVRASDRDARLLPSEFRQVPADGTPHVLELRMGATLDVTVVDRDGVALDRFEWTLHQERPGGIPDSRTGFGAAGHVALQVPPPGTRAARGLSLEVRAPDHVGVSKPVRYTGESARALRFELKPTRPLEGVVVRNGVPVIGAVVRVREERGVDLTPGTNETVGRYGPAQMSTTDGEGRYRLREVGAGTYTVCVTAPGCAPFVYASLGRGRAACLERIELETGGTVLGLVDFRWEEGTTGPPELRVRCRGENGVEELAEVRPNGSYVLYGVPAGHYTLQLERLRRASGARADDGEWHAFGTATRASALDGRLTTVAHVP